MERVALTLQRRRGPAQKTRSTSASPAPSVADVRTPFGAALPAAFWSAAVGLAAVTVLVVVGWAAAPDAGTPPRIAVAAGGQAWLLAQGATLDLTDGSLSLTPLGLLLLPMFVLARSGAWASRAADVRSWADAARTTGLLVVVYGLIGTGVALSCSTPAVQPDPWSAGLGTATVALLAGGWGVLRAAGLWSGLLDVLPPPLIPVVRGGLGALAVVVAGGGVLVASSMLVHAGQVGDLWSALGPDPTGAALLLLLSVCLVPNAVLWASAYAVGPGFAVGIGTSVAPTGVVVGAVPVLPLLGALPGAGEAPPASLAALLLPLAGGVVAGVLVARDGRAEGPGSPGWRPAALAAGAGALGGLALGLLCALSAGSLGGGRMAELGPAGFTVAVVSGLEMAVVAAAVCWEWRRLVRRRSSIDLTTTETD